MAAKAFEVQWGEDQAPQQQEEQPDATSPPTPSETPSETPTETLSAKKTAASSAKAEPVPAQLAAGDADRLTRLAADPVGYVTGLPGLRRGGASTSLNTNLYSGVGEWFTEWCDANRLTQREVVQALIDGLRDAVEGKARLVESALSDPPGTM